MVWCKCKSQTKLYSCPSCLRSCPTACVVGSPGRETRTCTEWTGTQLSTRPEREEQRVQELTNSWPGPRYYNITTGLGSGHHLQTLYSFLIPFMYNNKQIMTNIYDNQWHQINIYVWQYDIYLILTEKEVVILKKNYFAVTCNINWFQIQRRGREVFNWWWELSNKLYSDPGHVWLNRSKFQFCLK